MVAAPGLPPSRAQRRQVSCAAASATVHDKASSREQARTALLCLLNAERRKHGVRPLTENDRLRAAAFEHARWMVRNRNFSHFRPSGPDLVSRLRKVKYIPQQRILAGRGEHRLRPAAALVAGGPGALSG